MRDLITGAPGPDLERRIDDLERTVRDLQSELVSVRDRLETLEDAYGFDDSPESGC